MPNSCLWKAQPFKKLILKVKCFVISGPHCLEPERRRSQKQCPNLNAFCLCGKVQLALGLSCSCLRLEAEKIIRRWIDNSWIVLKAQAIHLHSFSLWNVDYHLDSRIHCPDTSRNSQVQIFLNANTTTVQQLIFSVTMTCKYEYYNPVFGNTKQTNYPVLCVCFSSIYCGSDMSLIGVVWKHISKPFLLCPILGWAIPVNSSRDSKRMITQW